MTEQFWSFKDILIHGECPQCDWSTLILTITSSSVLLSCRHCTFRRFYRVVDSVPQYYLERKNDNKLASYEPDETG